MNIFIGLGASWPENFGKDSGELEAIAAIKSTKLYAIGGINTPYNTNTSAQSVASVLALAASIGAQSNVIGYNAGDEPACGGTPSGAMEMVPTVVGGINGYDPTRVVTYNYTTWMVSPQYLSAACLSASKTALQKTSIGSFDYYPLTRPWGKVSGSDFISVPFDGLYMQNVAVQALIHNGRANQPMWAYVESGSDNFGFSEQNNTFAGGITAASKVLVNASGYSKFTSTWVGLTVSASGIPAGTTITSISDATHAVMSAAATGSNASATIAVTGGAQNSDCVASANLCVVNGNEYRPTPVQVNAEVWMSLISGANGIEYFCHDLTTYSFCLGDATGGTAAATTQANLTYVNKNVLAYAAVLNSLTSGICSMQNINYTTGALSTTNSCSNGVLTMATANSAVPGIAMVKKLAGFTYLFAQSDRRSPSGATFTFTLAGLAASTATVLYDSNAQYDTANSSVGKSFILNSSSQFSDTLGANNDHYQVKIYRVN
jgi:hypothetical protein